VHVKKNSQPVLGVTILRYYFRNTEGILANP